MVVARVTGFSVRWIEKPVARWNAEGPAGLGDRRRGNGAAPVLAGARLAALAAALDEGPADGGLWSGRKVAAWMSVYPGRPVDPKLGLDYLHRLGFSRQWPRPRHANAAGPEEQEAYKKNLAATVAAKAEAPGRPVELRAFDEHRLGLKPLVRRVWARRGQRPVAVSTHKYKWLYLYSFVRPATGAVEWWLANSVNVPLFQSVLDGFAATIGAGPDKIVILVLDGAGWHVSKRLRIPPGIRLSFLPPYTPELQPAEHLWPLADETVANRPFASLDELSNALDRRCSILTDDPAVIKANTNFHLVASRMNQAESVSDRSAFGQPGGQAVEKRQKSDPEAS